MRLRHALRNHINYIDSFGDTFVALVRGNLGSDPEHRAALNELRWQGAQRALTLLGISEPVPPILRTALLGTASYLDEMIIDRITNGDLDPDAIVELAVAHFAATLQTVARLDPALHISQEIIRTLSGEQLDP